MRLPISNYEPSAEKAISRVTVDFASIAAATTGCINQVISSRWTAGTKSSALYVERDVDMDDTARFAASLSPGELEEPRCPRCWHKGLVKDLGKPPGKFQLEDMLMAMKMSEFEEVHGFMGSPEWFEEDIAHGNF
ncbi:hypothetical protein N7449_010424 [Penicillium cf. viridicatum]|uniref:Uncharacterized protein n=1 Tax=Penicillium cf. viridicatum TaxID=2972119 RepID=A0A9W9IZ07_9EURO|nr:hypothetical protein N7449_010424 [Penicillium cf. viridicatum]